MRLSIIYGAATAGLIALATSTLAQEAATAPAEGVAKSQAASDNPNFVADHEEGGRYFTADDVPTFNIAADGTVDYPTYNGFRRYHSECHVCHGPDGEGSSYAPAIKNSAVQLDYYDFVNVVVNGRQVVDAAHNEVMPAFGNNANVMCYLDDIYTYLKARGSGELPRGRPAKKEAKSDAFREAENACLPS